MRLVVVAVAQQMPRLARLISNMDVPSPLGWPTLARPRSAETRPRRAASRRCRVLATQRDEVELSHDGDGEMVSKWKTLREEAKADHGRRLGNTSAAHRVGKSIGWIADAGRNVRRSRAETRGGVSQPA
jgi:hypothetical protein